MHYRISYSARQALGGPLACGCGTSQGLEGTITYPIVHWRAFLRVYGKFCIETLHERHNGIQRLVVCLSEYLKERSGPLVSNITSTAIRLTTSITAMLVLFSEIMMRSVLLIRIGKQNVEIIKK